MIERGNEIAALWPGIWSYYGMLKARGEDWEQGILGMLEIEEFDNIQIKEVFERIRAKEKELGLLIE